MAVLVIAEPGCTHEGDKATMLKLLETAHQCGANVWKPQWTSDPVQMCERRHIGPDHPKRAYYEQAYGWLAFPAEWHREFSEKCHAVGMKYAVTCFLPKDVWTVEPFVDMLKVSSFENDYSGLLMTARATGKRTIVSLGGRKLQGGVLNIPYHQPDALLCTSEYPARLRSMALDLIRQHGLGGLSDHSRRVNMGGYAVAKGATVIETHYRLETCHPSNPDFAVAFTPSEFAQYIANIRESEDACVIDEQARDEAQEWALPYRVVS